MKIYVLGGYGIDLSEQCPCSYSEVFTDESKARERIAEMKAEVEELLEDCYKNGDLEYYSVEHRQVHHNKFTLGCLSVKVTISPNNNEHAEFWKQWSQIGLGSGFGMCIDANDVCLKLDRSKDFPLVSLSIQVKEF